MVDQLNVAKIFLTFHKKATNTQVFQNDGKSKYKKDSLRLWVIEHNDEHDPFHYQVKHRLAGPLLIGMKINTENENKSGTSYETSPQNLSETY